LASRLEDKKTKGALASEKKHETVGQKEASSVKRMILDAHSMLFCDGRQTAKQIPPF
jgi:hypothetical protein